MNFVVLLKIEQTRNCFFIIKFSFNMTLFIIEFVIFIIIVAYCWSIVDFIFHFIHTIFILSKIFMFWFCFVNDCIIMLLIFEMLKFQTWTFTLEIIIACVCIVVRALKLIIVIQTLLSQSLLISFALIVCIVISSFCNCFIVCHEIMLAIMSR